jgi:hypothetical protein
VFELALLSVTAIRSSVRVADSIDLRLVPLNEDRAFVANMLVRAAFEMGATLQFYVLATLSTSSIWL